MIYSNTLDDSGYFYKIVENNETDATFNMKMQFTSSHGMFNVLNEASENLDIVLNVGPGESEVNILRRSNRGSGYGNTYIDGVMFGCKDLIKMALAEGKVTERAPGIKIHQLKHSSGIIKVYKNTSDSKTLKETLTL